MLKINARVKRAQKVLELRTKTPKFQFLFKVDEPTMQYDIYLKCPNLKFKSYRTKINSTRNRNFNKSLKKISILDKDMKHDT